MSIHWDIIMWCCITIFVLLLCFLIIYYVSSAKMIQKKRRDVVLTLKKIEPGKEVLFSGGIRGRVIKNGEEFLDVEISKGLEITISKMAVNQVIETK